MHSSRLPHSCLRHSFLDLDGGARCCRLSALTFVIDAGTRLALALVVLVAIDFTTRR